MRNDGIAIVLVYELGRLVAKLEHEHDGGEAYMGTLIRRAVQYAKAQYGSADIVKILLAEKEMRKVAWDSPRAYLRERNPRHLYRIIVRYDEQAARKTYAVEALHLRAAEKLCESDMVEVVKDTAATSADG